MLKDKVNTINASALSKEAYCIHPMLQDDSALLENINYCMIIGNYAIAGGSKIV